MGFSVSATHTIFIVAMLFGGASLGAAYVHSHDQVTEARRDDADLRDARLHTILTVASESYDAGTDTVTFQLDNDGSIVLDVRKLDFVVDGVYGTSNVDSGWTVGGVATNWWSPKTTLAISLSPYDPEPSRVVITTENGASVTWRI